MELYAFWNYDNFPYVCGGKIERMEGDLAYIKSYQGYCKPKKVMELNAGLELMHKLEMLTDEYNQEQKKLREKYELLRNKLLK